MAAVARAGALVQPSASRQRRRDERWLAGIWQRQAYDRRDLRTTAGLPFKIVYPGRCTGEAGPDFHDAILALADGRLLRGDVELHLASGGWQEHGHHLDPAYDRVVLHVVLEARQPTRNSRNELVPTLELGTRLHRRPRPVEEHRSVEPTGSRTGASQSTYVVQPCRGALPVAGQAEVEMLLRTLALERFHHKQAVFEGELAVREAEQVLYAGLMEALGYSRNKEPFRALAQLLPIKAITGQASVLQLEQLLLAGAGLLAGEEALRALADAGIMPLRLRAVEWQQVGVRPDNLPQQRIRQFAAILARLLPRLMDDLLAPLAELESSAPKAHVLGVRREWQCQLAEVGQQRTDAMAINVLLPFAAAYGQATCQFLLSDTATQAFLAYPAQGANQVTSYMRRDILGPLRGCASGAAGEQALVQAWERWCHEKVCTLCPLGRRPRR